MKRYAKLGMYIDNSDIQGQGAEGQQPCYYCPGEQCCPTTQGAEVDEGPVGKHRNEERKEKTHPHLNPAVHPTSSLHDKGLVDTKEHQEENSRPEGVVQVIACNHPDLS